MGTVTSRDGTAIGFASFGEGPPLVLVHGSTADHTRWSAVLPTLAEQYTVHAVDRRGRGLSGDHETYDIRREGEDIAAVIDAVGPDVFLVAHSYGALCSLEAALRTEAINRIVLYEPPGETPGHRVSSPALLAALEQAPTPDETVTIVFRDVLNLPPAEIEAMRGTPVWQARLATAPTFLRELRSIEQFTFSTRLASIDVPVRLLVGTESPAYFRPAAEAIAAQVPNVEIVDLPGQAHTAMDTAPDLFLEKVLTFRR
jgi:pimeloyl-ACP methyl ester carboxylesterase